MLGTLLEADKAGAASWGHAMRPGCCRASAALQLRRPQAQQDKAVRRAWPRREMGQSSAPSCCTDLHWQSMNVTSQAAKVSAPGHGSCMCMRQAHALTCICSSLFHPLARLWRPAAMHQKQACSSGFVTGFRSSVRQEATRPVPGRLQTGHDFGHCQDSHVWGKSWLRQLPARHAWLSSRPPCPAHTTSRLQATP